MQFFIPGTRSPTRREAVYDALKNDLGRRHGAAFSDRRVHVLQWHDNGTAHAAEVGRPTSVNGERVIAILFAPAQDQYYVCTPGHGLANDDAIRVRRAAVVGFRDFDDER